MINLIGMKKGETVCVHFVEQILHFLRQSQWEFMQLDFDEKMCKITKENFKMNKYHSEVIKLEFHGLSKISDKFDGIITDLPYILNCFKNIRRATRNSKEIFC